MALPHKLLLEGVPWISEQVHLLVLFEKILQVSIGFHKVAGHHFDDRENGSLVEVSDELLNLLAVRKVVAPWKDVRDLEVKLVKAVEPEVLA